MLKILQSIFRSIVQQAYHSHSINHKYSKSHTQILQSCLIIQFLINQIKELEQRERLRSKVLSHMSHELRAPLATIISFNQHVIRHNLINKNHAQALSHSTESAEQLLNFINNILDINKIEAGMMQLFIEDNIDIQNQLHTIAATVALAIEKKPIELKLNISSDIPYIIGDRRRIYQTILNLVSNAWKYTESGHIEIIAHIKDKQLVILIKDTGPGIAEDDLKYIFDPFEQTQIGLSSSISTGLGLSIAKTFVEAHGGEMIVQSQLGIGSTFGFKIPIRSQNLVYRMEEDMRREAG